MLSLLSVYTRALSFSTNISQLCVSIDYYVLSFNEYKLRLQKAVVNTSLFSKEPIVIYYNCCQLPNKVLINK